MSSTHVIGRPYGGRIDTLGLDENDCPLIIEYKRALNENVISQGLFYLDWLMDHQGDFTVEVQKKLGAEAASKINWSGPRLLCIAGDFSPYDEDAVLQIPRNIELLHCSVIAATARICCCSNWFDRVRPVVITQQANQMPFVERDDMIQHLPAAASNPTLRSSVLPWRPDAGTF